MTRDNSNDVVQVATVIGDLSQAVEPEELDQMIELIVHGRESELACIRGRRAVCKRFEDLLMKASRMRTDACNDSHEVKSHCWSDECKVGVLRPEPLVADFCLPTVRGAESIGMPRGKPQTANRWTVAKIIDISTDHVMNV